MKNYKERIRQKMERHVKQNQTISRNEKYGHQIRCMISEPEDGYEYPQCSEGLKSGKMKLTLRDMES